MIKMMLKIFFLRYITETYLRYIPNDILLKNHLSNLNLLIIN